MHKWLGKDGGTLGLTRFCTHTCVSAHIHTQSSEHLWGELRLRVDSKPDELLRVCEDVEKRNDYCSADFAAVHDSLFTQQEIVITRNWVAELSQMVLLSLSLFLCFLSFVLNIYVIN